MQLTGATILVVDDEPVLNLTMALVLRREGATVLCASNGEQALALMDQAGPIQAMVCDQNMPVMDGRTLIRTLHDSGKSVPTLFFVSSVARENIALLEAMQVRRLLTKPLQPTDLIAALQSVLESPALAALTGDCQPAP